LLEELAEKLVEDELSELEDALEELKDMLPGSR
jgi:hypothetical protein